jgi:hypothetical protein
MIPPEYLAGLEKAGIKTSGGIPYPRWSPQIALDVMDRNGIRAAITSVSSPGVYLGDNAFDSVYAELDRRRTVVFIHPPIHPSTKQVEIDLLEFMMEFMFDTTRAAIDSSNAEVLFPRFAST